MRKECTIQGTVKEVRVYKDNVILFLEIDRPFSAKERGMRLTLTDSNCNNPLTWAQLEIGTKVSITRITTDNVVKPYYKLLVLGHAIIDADWDTWAFE